MAAEIIAALLSKIDDTGLPDIEGLTKEEQAESVDHLINEANIPSKQTIPATAKKQRSKRGRKKKVKPADNASDSEYEPSKAEEQSLPVQRGAPRRRAALQARETWAPLIRKLSRKKNYPRHGWVTEDQTSDEEVGVFTRTPSSDSDLSSSETDTEEELIGAQALPLDNYDHDGAVLTEQDTDSYGDTDSLASLAAPAEEDGLDVSVYASLESTMVDREETEEMSRLSDELSVLMDDNSPKQVPPSSSPITERYNSEAARTFSSPVLSPSQVRLDRVTDLTQTLGVVQDRLDLAETERLQEATRQRPARNVQQPRNYKNYGWFGYK